MSTSSNLSLSPKRRPKPRPQIGWLRPGDFPISISLLKALIREGILESYSITAPGSGRSVRLVSVKSFDRWVRSGKAGL